MVTNPLAAAPMVALQDETMKPSMLLNLEEVRAIIEPLIARQHRAVIAGHGILAIRGNNNIYNPLPPPPGRWNRVISTNEFEGAVCVINEATIQALVGQSRLVSRDGVIARRAMTFGATTLAAAAITQHYAPRGVAFTVAAHTTAAPPGVSAIASIPGASDESACTLWVTFPDASTRFAAP